MTQHIKVHFLGHRARYMYICNLKVRKEVSVTLRAISEINHINPKIVVKYQTDTLDWVGVGEGAETVRQTKDENVSTGSLLKM